jgi:DnaJ-domain-containing protein 1
MKRCPECGLAYSHKLNCSRVRHLYTNTEHNDHSPPPQQPPPRRASAVSLSEQEIAHARVLGLRGKITFDDIKRCYRERMQEYHPDKVNSLGQKLRELADAESKKINLAYEFFRNNYGPNT